VQKELLDRSEAELSSYRLAKGSVDLSLETKGALDRAVEIDKALTEMSLQQTELRQRFTESHPSQAALRRKQEKLLAEKAAMERKLKLLPEAELESARLFRDVKTATELYFLLVNKAQELRVVKSGTIGNVRIIDMAVLPWAPVSPKKAPTLALSLLLGLALGVGFAFVRKALDQGVDDPEVVERATGVSVYATVPHSVRQDELVRQYRRDRTLARPVLAAHDKDDLAVEALRSLRTALQFSLLEARSNLLCVGGASPNAGKSFVATNLSWVLADAGKRVVLVDADLRKGRLHHYLGGDRNNGLSDVVAGVLPLEQALRPTQIAQLHFLPTGALPPNPLDLLGSERFRGVLDDLSLRYDLVLLDTPPILAVADGAVIARLAGVNMIVLRAGRHPVREIALAAKRYRQNGVVIHGAIMNDVKLEARFSGTYAYHYQYEYKRDV
jgi:tyrosine-protein kinase Etk/Wzc